MACSNFCTKRDLEQLSSPSISEKGAAGEKFARVVLTQSMGLKAYNFTRMSNNKGLDLAMRNPSQQLVVVEVKTTSQDKLFHQLLKSGYNVPERGGVQRQGSVGWLQSVRQSGLGQGTEADKTIRQSLRQPERVPVLGVQIDSKNETAQVWVRTDEDAFEWKRVTSQPIPLKHYVK